MNKKTGFLNHEPREIPERNYFGNFFAYFAWFVVKAFFPESIFPPEPELPQLFRLVGKQIQVYAVKDRKDAYE